MLDQFSKLGSCPEQVRYISPVLRTNFGLVRNWALYWRLQTFFEMRWISCNVPLKTEMSLRQSEQAVIVLAVVLTNQELFCAYMYIS